MSPPAMIFGAAGRSDPGQRVPVRARWRAARRLLGEIVVQLVEEPEIRSLSWCLPAGRRSPAAARRLTRASLERWEMDGLSDTAELLVSELTTNAVCHARGPIRLTLIAQENLLRCEVEDTGHTLPKTDSIQDADDFGEGGRGLHILDILACCWGGARTPTGKVMWFELSEDGDAAA
ncbi:ATP-binding protein [Sphaerimonospora sp. CA-214678]|uniref:ATP-binding protein n=1 Tax=Sphaerimonospora sp. CA-214678 TaxID=3240029 RepID=UPI003D8A64BD